MPHLSNNLIPCLRNYRTTNLYAGVVDQPALDALAVAN